MQFRKLLDNSVLLLFLLFIIAFLIYLPSKSGRFVGDIYYYFDGIEKQGFWGFLTSFGIIHQNQVPSFLIFFLYKIFGYSWVGWCLFYTGIHAFNAFLIIKLIQHHLPNQQLIALFSGLLFLVSPFQTEAVVWAACLHYLLCLTFLLLSLICIRKYYQSFQNKWVVFFGLSYLASLLCYEQAYVFPGVFFFYYLVLIQKRFEFKKLLKFSALFLSISLLLIGFHIFLNVLTYGKLIGHYGADTHVNFDLFQRFSTFKDYLFKFVLFYRYSPDLIKPFITEIFNSKVAAYSIFLIYCIVIFIFWKKRNSSSLFRFGLFAFIAFGVVISVVLNLETSFNRVTLSDRYGYSASAFIYSSIVVIIFSFSKKMTPFVVAGLLILMISLTLKETFEWGKNGDFTLNMIDNFPVLPDASTHFIVNHVDNFNGHISMRDGFREALDLRRDIQIEKKNFVRIADVNVITAENETNVQKLSSNSYKVESLKYGKWYRNHGRGMVNHEHDIHKYTCKVDEWNLTYILTFHQPIENGYLLKAAGSNWEIVDTLQSPF